MMPEYTAEETKKFLEDGLALGKMFSAVIAAQGNTTFATVIMACASLFAERAADKEHAEKLAKDLAGSVMSLYQLRTPLQ